ncbi:MAG TPA: DegT/DnrJ/EryC1/StrS family aminotransferase [Candidatus Deferrimicrobiaceae bacterium]|nr:DegT/DnrJ/EryC1/StrS family aminotransferase [Candidatus Deferrimicrobiaceae bacterium]
MTGPIMRVKYMDLPRQFEDGVVVARVMEEFKRCQFVLGPQVAEFEARFARACGAAHAVGLNSGTDALFFALRALRVGPGDEVITVPNSFVATAGAIVMAGATPVFVDVNAEYLMDPARLADAITPRTRAIIPVHLTGNPADLDAIAAIAAPRSLPIIEDAAQAVGAAIGGRVVGSIGAAAAFSLFPLKNLGVAGDGGMLTTGSRELFDKVMLFRHHGLRTRDEVEVWGYNSRLDTIQAIVADAVLDGLQSVTAARIRNAAFYDRALAPLAPQIIVPPRRPGVRQVFHTYVVQAERRDGLREFLDSRGVETKIHYPIPIHLQKAALGLGYKRGAFPVCEAQSERIVSLPVHEYLTPAEQQYVVDRIREFYRR